MSKDSALKDRLDFAVRAAWEAGKLILDHYQHAELQVEHKGDLSPVTAADRGAEELLRAQIGREFPNDGILGEEFPEKTGTSGYRWILDPVDGTKSFIYGVPLFGTLIGIEHQGRCVLGVCRFPALDEVVYAAEGMGAWWQVGDRSNRQVHVSTKATLKESLFCTTTLTRWDKVGKRVALDHLLQNAKLTRGWGDCFGHILVATGRAEVMVDPALSPWDAAALVPILQEAGGHFLDFEGKPSIYSGNGFSVNAALKDEMLRILKM